MGIYNVIEKGSNGEKFIGFVFMEPKLNVNYPHETDGISFYILKGVMKFAMANIVKGK